MIIYNITIQVTWAIHGAWLEWMQHTHIGDIMKTGCFVKYQVVRLLEINDAEGPTYAVQFYAENMDNYNTYIEGFAEELRQESFRLWGNQFIAFRSLMQIVH